MSQIFRKKPVLGILAGGQLGRMLIPPALALGLKTRALDPTHHAPIKDAVSEIIHADYQHYDDVYQFGKEVDVLTIEFEHVNVEALTDLEKEGVRVYPQAHVIKIVQNKALQKQFYRDHDIPTPEFHLLQHQDELKNFIPFLPAVQKTAQAGYDGKGVCVLNSEEDLSKALAGPCVLEKKVDLSKELSVIVARNLSGEIVTYPPVEMVFEAEANLLDYLLSPARISEDQQKQAEALAIRIAETLGIVGILAVELFVDQEGKLWVNEIAPRPHNSGHHTIEGNITSQFEQHIRAIFDLPLGATDLIKPACMVNLLGNVAGIGPVQYDGMENALKVPHAHLHLYGKHESRPFRKMGHLTVLHDDLSTAQTTALDLKRQIQIGPYQPQND